MVEIMKKGVHGINQSVNQSINETIYESILFAVLTVADFAHIKKHTYPKLPVYICIYLYTYANVVASDMHPFKSTFSPTTPPPLSPNLSNTKRQI